MWLERYLRKWKHILLLVSHSQDFLNTVCTNIILLRNQTLTYALLFPLSPRVLLSTCVAIGAVTTIST